MKKKFIWLLFAVFVLSYNVDTLEFNQPLKIDDNNFGEAIDLSDTLDADVITYYSGIDGQTGDELKSALNTIISSSTSSISDSKTWDWMKITDRDWSISDEVDPETYDFDTDTNYYYYNLYASYNGDVSTAINREMNTTSNVLVDREHCWPKSLGFKSSTTSTFVQPAGTDLHHLMASDHTNNNKHSNYAFGNVDTSLEYQDVYDEDSQGATEATGLLGYSAFSINSASKVYEPADEYKGDVARASLYMATRYQATEDLSSSNPFLTLVDEIADMEDNSDGDGGIGYYGELTTMLEWNELDPVDSYEIHRNNLIYNNVQNNRNPYVDHPEWAEIVYDTSYSGTGAVNDNPYVPTEGSADDTGDTTTDVQEISESTTITYTINNYLCQSDEADQTLIDESTQETLIGNQVNADVLESSYGNFGAMFVNGKYKSGKSIGQNKMALTATDTKIDNYYTNSGESLVVVLDQNSNLVSHFAIVTGSQIDQDTIDGWTAPSAPSGYTFDDWYIDDLSVDTSTAISGTTIIKAKLTYSTDNTSYQVVAFGDNVILEDSSGNTGTELDIQFDKMVTATSSSTNFSYWKIGDRIVSYDSEYKFSVYVDTIIEEVTGETVDIEPIINLYHDEYDSGMDNYWVCGFDVPSAYTFVETGVIFGGETYVDATNKVVADTITDNNEYAVYYNGSDSTTCAAYLIYMSGETVNVIYDDGYGYEQIYFKDIESCTDAILAEHCTYSRGTVVLTKNDKLYKLSEFDGIKFGSSTSTSVGQLTITLPEGLTSSSLIVHAKQYASDENTLYANDTLIENLQVDLDFYTASYTSSNEIILSTAGGKRAYVDYVEIFYDN
jgi:endonuclease I